MGIASEEFTVLSIMVAFVTLILTILAVGIALGVQRRTDMRLITKRLDDVNSRFDQVDKRFDQVDKRFDQVDSRFDQVDKRFDQVDKRLDKVDKRLDALEDRQREDMKALSALFLDLARDVSTLKGRIDEVGRMVSGSLQAAFGAVIARPGGEGRRPAAIEQATFAEPVVAKD